MLDGTLSMPTEIMEENLEENDAADRSPETDEIHSHSRCFGCTVGAVVDVSTLKIDSLGIDLPLSLKRNENGLCD